MTVNDTFRDKVMAPNKMNQPTDIHIASTPCSSKQRRTSSLAIRKPCIGRENIETADYETLPLEYKRKFDGIRPRSTSEEMAAGLDSFLDSSVCHSELSIPQDSEKHLRRAWSKPSVATPNSSHRLSLRFPSRRPELSPIVCAEPMKRQFYSQQPSSSCRRPFAEASCSNVVLPVGEINDHSKTSSMINKDFDDNILFPLFGRPLTSMATCIIPAPCGTTDCSSSTSDGTAIPITQRQINMALATSLGAVPPIDVNQTLTCDDGHTDGCDLLQESIYSTSVQTTGNGTNTSNDHDDIANASSRDFSMFGMSLLRRKKSKKQKSAVSGGDDSINSSVSILKKKSSFRDSLKTIFLRKR